MIHFLNAPPARAMPLSPMLTRHLCTPRQDQGVLVSGPGEDPNVASGHSLYSFALGPNPTVQRDWRLRPLNGVQWGKGGGSVGAGRQDAQRLPPPP